MSLDYQQQQQQNAYPNAGNVQPAQTQVQQPLQPSPHHQVATSQQQPSQPQFQMSPSSYHQQAGMQQQQQQQPLHSSSPYHQRGVPPQQPQLQPAQPSPASYYYPGVQPQQQQPVVVQQQPARPPPPPPTTVATSPNDPQSATQMAGYGKVAFIFAIVTTIVSIILCWPTAFCSGVGIYFAANSIGKLSTGEYEEGKKNLKWSLSCTSCSLSFVCIGFFLVVIIATAG